MKLGVILMLVCQLILVRGERNGDVRNVDIPEVFYNNKWYRIGRSDFRLNTAVLVCQQFQGLTFVYYTIIKTDSRESVVEIECDGDEKELNGCEFEDAQSEYYVHVICLNNSGREAGSAAQLSDNRTLILYENEQFLIWVHICYQNDSQGSGWDSKAANLFCQDLGFRAEEGLERLGLQVNEQKYYSLKMLNCSNATRINECSVGIIESNSYCEHSQVIATECVNSIEDKSLNNFTSKKNYIINYNPTISMENATITEGFSYIKLAAILTTSVTVVMLIILMLLCGLFIVFRLKNGHKVRSNPEIVMEVRNPRNNGIGQRDYAFPVFIKETGSQSVSTSSNNNVILFESFRGTHQRHDVYSKTAIQFSQGSFTSTDLEWYEQIVPTIEEREISNCISNKSMEDIMPCFIDENDKGCWQPECTVRGIYRQMSRKRFREIYTDDLVIKEQLGEGNFGKVHSGLWTSAKGRVEVAIKTQKVEGTASNISFLQEAAILGQFNHPNILKLLGVVTLTDPLMMVTELMKTGLKQFLLTVVNSSSNVSLGSFVPMFLRFTRDIAQGMRYLTIKKYIHRDLAARNILLSYDMSCKISDFGYSRSTRESEYYYMTSDSLIPIKWTSPEALFYKKYSEKSDVWSYGVTLYEIWSVGKMPWAGLNTNQVIGKLSKQNYLPRPSCCPSPIYQLMKNCWYQDKNLRPSFEVIVNSLKNKSDDILLHN